MKKVCIVTGTRAEYGLLKPVMDKVHRSDEMELQLIVTGMHLSTEFGLTYREIEEDGYPITAKVEMLLSSDTTVGVTKSMGVALLGFADYFEAHRPDIVVILGDRYEMFMAASAAMVARIPIAHIHGGELTGGAIDESIRHSITKMSHLHFTATERYRQRVIQLGEPPQTVFHVGALGIENARTVQLLSKEVLEKAIDFRFTDAAIMVTYHPVTLEKMTSEGQFRNLLDVIERHKELSVIFTKANSDTDGRVINAMIDDFVKENEDRCRAYTSLGQLKYLSALQFCCAVVGNSSSGIIEAPSFGIPTVNIGDRQKGRICAESVLSCGNGAQEIEAALARAMSPEFQKIAAKAENPYEGVRTSDRIVETIRQSLDKGIDLKKEFYDKEFRT
ncbi:MAG: UDP-N-acetylglucosamine 2-epimerase (hydrolyzing) [Lachnospiraceae bacterium]|nr:UDP-N-acetylglucosamine 2-epimerase (hydrolyzing) [Lachnospiraceae bacterium]